MLSPCVPQLLEHKFFKTAHDSQYLQVRLQDSMIFVLLMGGGSCWL